MRAPADAALCLRIVIERVRRQYRAAVSETDPRRPTREPVCRQQARERADGLCVRAALRQRATGLRFFTVYGPWGRPDMATLKFTQSDPRRANRLTSTTTATCGATSLSSRISSTELIAVFDKVPRQSPDGVPHRIYNIGNHRPEPLLRFIEVLSVALGRNPEMRFLPMQVGDVKETFADITDLNRDYGWAPTTTIDAGLPRFVKWYEEYYGQ